jgi:hypothetical protein
MSLLWKAAVEAAYPTREPVSHITSNYSFADGDSWPEVKENYDTNHPRMKSMFDDVRRNGVTEPIRIDYEQSPPQVVDGHTRLMAAEAAGHTHVPVKHGTFADVHYYGE